MLSVVMHEEIYVYIRKQLVININEPRMEAMPLDLKGHLKFKSHGYKKAH